MQVHEFIEGNKPIMVLIHGVLTPWQIWTPQITAFKERYVVFLLAEKLLMKYGKVASLIFAT